MRKNKSSEDEELSIKFVEVRVKGNSETLQTAIRSITEAVSGRPIITRVAPVQALPATEGQGSPLQTAMTFDDPTEGEVVDPPSNAKPATAKPKARSTYPQPKLLDIELDKGDVPFKVYVQQKSPSNMTKKYLVCACWLKEHRGIQYITADHIYTCFRKMGWGVQKDMGQPLRSAKKVDYFRSGPQAGSFELTHIGEDVIRQMGANS